ncbi:MAG: hypothetical protein JSR33_09140 [Proteobacteria bacterium]|nr:hypothetical protein [Pseudomonadota bacterium]
MFKFKKNAVSFVCSLVTLNISFSAMAYICPSPEEVQSKTLEAIAEHQSTVVIPMDFGDLKVNLPAGFSQYDVSVVLFNNTQVLYTTENNPSPTEVSCGYSIPNSIYSLFPLDYSDSAHSVVYKGVSGTWTKSGSYLGCFAPADSNTTCVFDAVS